MSEFSTEPTKADPQGDSFSGRVRRILRIRRSEAWRGRGYKSFFDWAKNFASENPGYLKRATIYQFSRIGECLGHLSDADLEAIGVEKCKILAEMVGRKGRPTDEWVAKAKTPISVDEFRRAVKRRTLGHGGRESYGELLDPPFRGLQYGPTNELGVVFLFGMVAKELGFMVRCVRSRYPDCIADRCASRQPERWEKVNIEFEFLTSRFKHPREGADLIVCWEDDRPGRSPLDVLELKSEIRKLPRVVKASRTRSERDTG